MGEGPEYPQKSYLRLYAVIDAKKILLRTIMSHFRLLGPKHSLYLRRTARPINPTTRRPSITKAEGSGTGVKLYVTVPVALPVVT